jgi:hypothetical protein
VSDYLKTAIEVAAALEQAPSQAAAEAPAARPRIRLAKAAPVSEVERRRAQRRRRRKERDARTPRVSRAAGDGSRSSASGGLPYAKQQEHQSPPHEEDPAMSVYLQTAIEDASRVELPPFTLAADTVVAAPIDEYRSDPTGQACATGPQAGATALRNELQRRFGGRGEIFNCRPVRGAKRLSLHGEGRAVDWYRNVADPAEAAEAKRILGWLLGTDTQGNEHALARRMGVQEIIWNRRIWTARRHAEGWRAYSGVNPHTDHIHIGLNWAGARMQTSHWTAPEPATAAGLTGALGATTWVSGPAALPRAARGGRELNLTLPPAKAGAPPQPPALGNEDVGGSLAALDAGRKATVAAIAAARQEFDKAHGARITLGAYTQRQLGRVVGWIYSGIRKELGPDPTPRQITTPAAGVDPRATRAQSAVWEELRNEGGISSINSYDEQIVSWGRGLGGNSGAMGEAMDHALADGAVRDAFLGVGISRESGRWLVVNTRTGAVEEGNNALALMAAKRDVLASLSAISEHPSFRQTISDAQWSFVAGSGRAGDVPDFAYDWDPRVIRFVAHMTHAGPAYGWSKVKLGSRSRRDMYKDTGGDMARVLVVFGRLRCGKPEEPSGAFKVSTQTALVASWMRHWGTGVAADTLATGSGPLDITDAQIAGDAELRGRLVLKMPEGGYYVFPALSKAKERQLGANVHERYLTSLNGMSMHDMLPAIEKLRATGLLEHYFSRDALIHARPITHEERIWWAKEVVSTRTVPETRHDGKLFALPPDQLIEAYKFLGKPVPANLKQATKAQALVAPSRTGLPGEEEVQWDRRAGAAAKRIDDAGHKPGQPLRGAGTAPVDAGIVLPKWFMSLQHKLSMSKEWQQEEEDAQRLLRDYAIRYLTARRSDVLPANLRYLFEYVGRSSINDAKARPKYRGVAVFGGGVDANGKATKNWCTAATTKGVINALKQLGYAPNDAMKFLNPGSKKLNGQPLTIGGPAAYGAELMPGDMVMYLFDKCQYGGHTVTVVDDLDDSFVHISGNTGDAIGLALGEAGRLKTPPPKFDLARANRSTKDGKPDKEVQQATNTYIAGLSFGKNMKLVYSIVRFSAIFAELERLPTMSTSEQQKTLATLGLRKVPAAQTSDWTAPQPATERYELSKTPVPIVRAAKGRVELKEAPADYCAAILRNAGLDPVAWFSTFTRFTFLGRVLADPIHVDLASHLQAVQQQFVDQYGGAARSPSQAAKALGITSVGGSRRSPTSAALSMHLFGLAIDVNYTANPFISESANPVFARAGNLIGEANVGYKAGMPYEQLARVNNVLQAYFAFIDAPDERLERSLKASTTGPWNGLSAAEARKQIKADLDLVAAKWERTGAAQKAVIKSTGFMDIDRRFIDGVGLSWGGAYGDVMHFDMRNTGNGRKISGAIHAYKALKDQEAQEKVKAH